MQGKCVLSTAVLLLLAGCERHRTTDEKREALVSQCLSGLYRVDPVACAQAGEIAYPRQKAQPKDTPDA